MVANGGDIEARNANGRTPLIEQADNQQNGTDVVVALLASGANANAKDFDDQTALSLAQQTNNQDLARVLRRAGAEE
ncbi:ankyrin repeat domain-containing protein [Brucellaceae bacterium D45D]